jgi:hypothetical protein
MRIKVLAFATSLFLISNLSAGVPQTQTATTSSPQASTVLAQSLKALIGLATVNDVTLSGTAERIAGSEDETGTATYNATPTASRLDLNLSGGTRTEIHATSATGPAGNWIGQDSVVHQIRLHNLLTDVGWFPIFTLSSAISSTNTVLAYVGPETRNGISVIHIQAWQKPPNPSATDGALWQRLSQMDIYLNASTLLPTALDLKAHADNNALADIAVEVLFSDYRTAGSLTIPFHVQQFRNGSLFLDLQFQQATVNSGLSSSSTLFAIQ